MQTYINHWQHYDNFATFHQSVILRGHHVRIGTSNDFYFLNNFDDNLIFICSNCGTSALEFCFLCFVSCLQCRGRTFYAIL